MPVRGKLEAINIGNIHLALSNGENIREEDALNVLNSTIGFDLYLR